MMFKSGFILIYQTSYKILLQLLFLSSEYATIPRQNPWIPTLLKMQVDFFFLVFSFKCVFHKTNTEKKNLRTLMFWQLLR